MEALKIMLRMRIEHHMKEANSVLDFKSSLRLVIDECDYSLSGYIAFAPLPDLLSAWYSVALDHTNDAGESSLARKRIDQIKDRFEILSGKTIYESVRTGKNGDAAKDLFVKMK